MIITKYEIPFFQYSIENWQEKKQNIIEALPDYKSFSVDDKHSTDNNHYSDYHRNANVAPEYANVVIGSIEEEIKKFCDDTRSSWDMTRLWFQTYEKTNSFSVHNHGMNGFSAILYLDFNKDEHSPTIFYSPYPSWKREYNGAYESFRPDVNEGDILFFPSMLQHESPANSSESKRTIISFTLR